jgi:hypothetical protein
MKTILPLLLVMVALTGCNSKRDARVAQLEARLATLEQKLDERDGEFAALTNGYALHISNVTAQVEMNGYIMDRFQIAVAGLTNQMGGVLEEIQKEAKKRPATVTRYIAAPIIPAAEPVGGTVQGIPTAVYRQIVTRARNDWPDDFGMQEFRIKEEVESYRRLNR